MTIKLPIYVHTVSGPPELFDADGRELTGHQLEEVAEIVNATVPAPDLTAALARWKAAYEEWEWQQHPGRYRLDMTVAALEEASEALYGILKDGTP